jgi:hypothetical protein
MSETLRVLLKGVELDASQRAEFERQYRVAASSVIPPSAVAALRLVFRAEPNETSIEPFLGSAALEALLGIPRKRPDAMALLVRLVASAFLVAEHVDVLLVAEDELREAIVRRELSLEALATLSKRERGRFSIRPTPA